MKRLILDIALIIVPAAFFAEVFMRLSVHLWHLLATGALFMVLLIWRISLPGRFRHMLPTWSKLSNDEQLVIEAVCKNSKDEPFSFDQLQSWVHNSDKGQFEMVVLTGPLNGLFDSDEDGVDAEGFSVLRYKLTPLAKELLEKHLGK